MAKVLVVDDEEMIRDILETTLSMDGHTCYQAKNAEEALELVAQLDIDLALLDIIMPGRSGVQLLYELKQESPDTSVIMASALTNLETALFCVQMGAEDYITKPLNIDRVRITVMNILEKRRLRMENLSYQNELEQRVLEKTEQLQSAMLNLHQAYEQTLAALVKALDAREEEVGAHSDRVQAYTILLAKTMGIEETEIEQIARGALLHDIGKIGVPNSILLKPAKLDPNEWEVIKKHPETGYRIISEVAFLQESAQIILSHHERFDGTGYPYGLKGIQIPLGARIFSIADTIDAMTSDRPYRKALTFDAVVDEITRCSGTQFDPDIVKIFLSIPLSKFEQIRNRFFGD